MNNKGMVRLKWLLLLGVAALAAGGWWFFQRSNDDVPQFQTAKPAAGDVTQAVTATGTLNPVLNVQVGSQISGIILKLFADFNSPVKANQIVAQLDPATYQANVHSAEGDLANAKAGLEFAQVDARRAAELLKNNLISQSEHDKTQATLHQSEAQVQIKEAALERARVDLARCTIYAPVDGIVIDRKVDVGQTVAASMNAPVLFLIANDLTKMQIDASVSEADIGTITDNQPVNFTVDAFPGRTFIGKVIQIRNSPTTVQNVVTYDTVIEVNNPDLKLKPGMTANVSIVTAERKGVLKIPNSAFRFKPTDAITNLVLAAVGETNKTAATPAFTGNESPQELQKRVSEMRERGEEVPQAIRDKVREYYKSGVLQRPAGSGHGGGEGGGHFGGGSRSASPGQPTSRTVYLLAKNSSGEPALRAVRIKTGISDGVATEVIEGLKETDEIVTGLKSSSSQISSAPQVNSFIGGMSRRY
ncbi:MAG: efflux RND transporter periplasmic adaptor subunit [Verrucomicrobia bacterium]|nr:efflux RND transporter periplasmic adaptor subunit [Verrucomicrobiota bacterium]